MKLFLLSLLCITANLLHGQDSLPVKKQGADTLAVKTLDEVIISASRMQEKILQSPVSIEKLNSSSFKTTPAPSFYDALQQVKGVQMITPSLGFRVINMRGFTNTTNVRFAQLIDGMDIQSPHIGAPVGNALGPTDLDIQSVEVLPGAAAALYGMNAINGMANLFTKNPFTSAGFSIQQKTGINHINDPAVGARIFSETSLRLARVLSKQFAFKINAAFSKGYDWVADDHTDLNAAANNSTRLTGAANPGADPVNGYGNESSNRRTLSLQGKNYVVARTGYYEKEVVDYGLQNIKADAGIYYKPRENYLLTYTWHIAGFNTVYQRSNRFRLERYGLQQHALDFAAPSIKAKAYITMENTGQSYNLRSMAENMDRLYKTDDAWFAGYTSQFNSAVAAGQTVAMAHTAARAFADAGRAIPGTDAFNAGLQKLQDINNWDSGAALRVKARLVHAEIQVDLTKQYLSRFKSKTGIDLLLGLDTRTYIIVPDGNYFINPEKPSSNKNLLYGRNGGFVSVNRSFFNSKLKTGLVFRLDKNDHFNARSNTRISTVYSPVPQHNFRFSFQDGYRYPSIFEAFSNVNSGGVKRVGGLRVMSTGIFEYAWLKSSIDAFQAAVTKDVNTGGLSRNAAIEKNKTLLVQNNYTYLQPEHVHSFEMGYKGLFIDKRLLVDVDLYYNKYQSFIAQVEVSVPRTQQADSVPYALYDKKTQERYRMWTNSKTRVYNYGFGARLKYDFTNGYVVDGKLSYARLTRTSTGDGLEDGFNTPQWMTSITVSKEQLFRRVGAAVVWSWQDSYYWQSFLVNGDVPAYSTLDAQINYRFRHLPLGIKLGASNLLNHYYSSFLGGPQIGGFYYTTLTCELQ